MLTGMAHIDTATATVVGGAAEIKALLRELDVSQRELARRLGWTQPRIQGRLAGTIAITVGDIEEIAAALDVPVSRLIPLDTTGAAQ